MSAEATERGRRVISQIVHAGRLLGLDVKTEYPVVGGRIDVVWVWRGPKEFPIELPLVGFEVESSWRTRKHLKGDYLNLVDLQASLGVIVLLGDDVKVESTREFTQVMLDRHAGRIELWSEGDVENLLTREPGLQTQPDLLLAIPDSKSAPLRHVGKYRGLAQWLAGLDAERRPATFGDLEEILGFPLPGSCRRHPAHWSSYEGSAVARAIQDAGWRATNVDLKAQTVVFERRTLKP
jgi:hypothetical protein